MLNKVTWPTSTRARDLPDAGPQEPTIDLVEAFRLVRRQWKLVATIVGLATSLGVAYLVMTPTRFTASSLLLFDTRLVQPFQQQSYPNSVADSAYVDSQVEVLKSESTARSVIRNLDLLSDPEFTAQGRGLITLIFNAVFGAGKQSAEDDKWASAIATFQRNLSIKRIGLTYIIQVGYRSSNKSKAAQISNAVAQAYILGQLESKYQAARYADAWLQDRIGALKAQSQNAERAVAEFKARNNVVDTTTRPLSEQQLADLSTERRILLKDLESAAQTYRTLYESFLQRVTEVTQQQSFPAMESRVVSEASPMLVKRDPNALLILSAASLVGLVCALGAVFAREYFGTGFRSPRQVEKEVGIDCLGILPTIKPAREIAKRLRERLRFHAAEGDRVISPLMGRHRFVVGEPLSRFAETIRSLKVAADTAGLRRATKVIGVTSARPHEGKSVVAANLSEMIALFGSKALLVDCNLRNAGLTEQLAPKATAGLMDIVAGQATVKDLIWSDPVTTVEFLPAVKDPVPRDPNGHEDPAILCQRAQLAPAGLQKLLQSVEDCYDYVILDFPPITVADVKATSHLIDCFILVIEWGRTSRQIVIDALTTAPLVSEKLLGAVLNKAELSRLDS